MNQIISHTSLGSIVPHTAISSTIEISNSFCLMSDTNELMIDQGQFGLSKRPTLPLRKLNVFQFLNPLSIEPGSCYEWFRSHLWPPNGNEKNFLVLIYFAVLWWKVCAHIFVTVCKYILCYSYLRENIK